MAVTGLRAKFSRGPAVKYIAHLDTMKLFERVLRRSGIPVSYSKGFNPHPRMVFGLPLSMGMTSDAEIVDFDLEYPVDPVCFKTILNSEMPAGMRIVDAKTKASAGNIMASVVMASYEVTVRIDNDKGQVLLEDKLAQILNAGEVFAEKTSKGVTKRVDIRPLIKRLEIAGRIDDDIYMVRLDASAGGNRNLRPEVLFGVIFASGADGANGGGIVSIHRTGLFVEKSDKSVVDPMDPEVL